MRGLLTFLISLARLIGLGSFIFGITGMFVTSLLGAMDQSYVTRAIDSALVMAYANAVGLCLLHPSKDPK